VVAPDRRNDDCKRGKERDEISFLLHHSTEQYIFCLLQFSATSRRGMARTVRVSPDLNLRKGLCDGMVDVTGRLRKRSQVGVVRFSQVVLMP
jgi:hypothetical protein